MGRRHGRGGSDDGDEWGKSAFWGPDEQAEPPGWPSLPDQPEVTGQWAPMPRRTDAPPPAPQSEPYETTGAFALPGDPAAFPAAGSAGGFPPGAPEEAGPYETTGAFARPPEWDAPPNQPSGRPFDGPDTGDFFPVSADQTAVFGGGPDGRDAFDGDRTARFDAPYGGPPEAGDRTAGFDAPYGGPPEPGDVKVAGSPTAMPAPAWANAETGFLDSGSLGDSGDEPKGRRGRRKRGGDDVLAAPEGAGKGKMALLSVAAVAVVLGGTVAGVSFISSPGDPAACEGTSCTAVQESAGQPAPEVADPVEEESETVPDEDPVEEESTAPDTPTPTADSNVGTPRRTASAAPEPTRTKAKSPSSATQDEPPADTPVEAVEEASETPQQEVSVLDDAVTDTLPRKEDAPTPADTGTPNVPAPQQPLQQPGQPQQLAPGGSVGVEQSISQRAASYQAELTVSNTSARTLQSATVSMPVNGRVVDVDGADWTQDGDLLILDVETPLPAGESVEVSFTATGKGAEAQNCGLVTGECVVT
ncbi:hypothetical protein [Nonomuraea aridisoli]|uniref:CBM2 domain-containing protein n=1 Tax=Nonomuraea aridisoli TaxID=2070368 RepID=A0A2W2DR64_9ACTN|nr:hypothetical protein [Nonomuraea aridisoli]PZG13083.1 hypothetical protein C1J01_31000 [Nonomuraea aridisoli]